MTNFNQYWQERIAFHYLEVNLEFYVYVDFMMCTIKIVDSVRFIYLIVPTQDCCSIATVF